MRLDHNRLPCLALLLMLLTACLAPAALADDAWLIADPAEVRPGESVWLGFVGGQVFPLSETLVAPEDLESLVDLCGGLTRTLSNSTASPAATGRRETLAEPGLHVFAGQMWPLVVEMAGTQFDDYLNEERAVDAILERLHDDPDAAVVEEYTRFAKTLVQVGPGREDDTGYAVIAGHRLEIIPSANPCLGRPGDSLAFEIRLDGYPWPDVPISACREGYEAKTYVAETRTDDAGHVEIQIDQEGLWLVRAHVIRRTDGLRKAEWESFWATLTFRVGGENRSSEEIDEETADEGTTATDLNSVGRDDVDQALIAPVTFPLDELYGYFLPYLQALNHKAA